MVWPDWNIGYHTPGKNANHYTTDVVLENMYWGIFSN